MAPSHRNPAAPAITTDEPVALGRRNDYDDERELHYLVPAFQGSVGWREGKGDPAEHAAGAAREDMNGTHVTPVVRLDDPFEEWEVLVIGAGRDPEELGIEVTNDPVEADAELMRHLRTSFSGGATPTPTRLPSTQEQRQALAGRSRR